MQNMWISVALIVAVIIVGIIAGKRLSTPGPQRRAVYFAFGTLAVLALWFFIFVAFFPAEWIVPFFTVACIIIPICVYMMVLRSGGKERAKVPSKRSFEIPKKDITVESAKAASTVSSGTASASSATTPSKAATPAPSASQQTAPASSTPTSAAKTDTSSAPATKAKAPATAAVATAPTKMAQNSSRMLSSSLLPTSYSSTTAANPLLICVRLKTTRAMLLQLLRQARQQPNLLRLHSLLHLPLTQTAFLTRMLYSSTSSLARH